MLNKYYYYFFFFFFFSLVFFYFGILFCLMDYFYMFEYELFYLNSFCICYVIILDWKSLIFCSVVIFISSMVILYSSEYMGVYSYSSLRFLYIVFLFVISMLLMIISPNLFSILLGWDGLGLVSYCLVIYYNSMKSYLSGMITCLTNRLGDSGILISLSWMFSFGSWHFMFYNSYYLNFLVFLVILSCFTKSAQIPFSCWLPAAMAAPTPVSSLVHSSTLVTAGVYLLIRFFSWVEVIYSWFLYFGLFTMVFSSFCANYEFDLKKIIALSTLSQLGLMICSIFLNQVDYSYFHMLSHAMFKSLLFLCSGIYIYNMGDNQDIRFMGSCCCFMPLTTSCFNISNLSLCGIPFLSGFYSKDLIVELSLFNGLNSFVFILFYMSLGLTCCYTSRLFYYTVFKKFNLYSFSNFLDYIDLMSISIMVLTFFSVVFGCSFLWVFNIDFYFIILPMYYKLLTISMVFFGLWFGYEFNNFSYSFPVSFYFFNSYMWFMGGYLNFLYKLFYNYGIISYNLSFWGEFSTSGLSFYLTIFSNFFQDYINNNMKIYLLTFILWFFFFF
uniref:NADH-ubiquinone oxidoreductase chain 5 n=1 Tax=Stictocephala bisonia TaxID=1585304 RepID=A0A894JJ65_9HEMI|nr:NADH dehydrogenase subunit 5 [Stictocephala bisonia]QRV59924.1 NADH dehydrogenase subunit 5 [Stictocephala bisonia]